MTELPSGWSMTTIGDALAPQQDGRTLHQGWSPRCDSQPSESDDVWGVLKTTAIQAGQFLPEHNKRLPPQLVPRPLLEVSEGDVLITCAGPRSRCGVACLVTRTRPRLMISGKIYRMRFDSQNVDARYVAAYLQSPEAQLVIDRMKTGGSDSGLNLTHDRFRRLPLPLAPLDEQRRIVDGIEEQFSRLDSAEKSLRRGRANLANLKLSAFVEAFVGDWPTKQLDEVTDPERVICYGILKPKTVGDCTVPYVEVRSIRDGRIDVPKLNRTTEVMHRQFLRSELRPGDVVLAIRGSFDRAAVVPAELAGANVSRDVARIAPTTELNAAFLAHFLSGPAAYRYFSAQARGVAVKGVNIGDLRKMPIPFPSLAEQQRIVREVDRRLSVIENMDGEVETAMRTATSLRRAVLRDAFSGRLAASRPLLTSIEGLVTA